MFTTFPVGIGAVRRGEVMLECLGHGVSGFADSNDHVTFVLSGM